MKICYIASSGGHLSEIKKVISSDNTHDYFLVTEKTSSLKKSDNEKVYYVQEINRKEIFFLFKFALTVLREFFIFLKEKPDVVISTGALISYPMFKIAKLFKKKTIYIESFARVYSLSKTGSKLYGKVDLFFVQREELKQRYEKALFVGNLFGE